MKLKINLFIEEDGYEKAYPVIIFDGNIIPVIPNELPDCEDERVNFQFQYAPTYVDKSHSKVNTRFLYPYSRNYKRRGIEGYCEAYALLNRRQRMKLSFINKTSIFHKHPFPIAFLIVNIIGFIPVWISFLSPDHVQYNQVQTPNSQIILQDTTKGNDSLQFGQTDSLKEK